MEKKIKISSALLLVLLIISIFVLLFTSSIAYRRFQSVTDSERLVIHSYKIIHSLEELMSLVKDAETGQRGYLLTRDSSFLEPYEYSRSKINAKINKVKRLSGTNFIQQNKIDSLGVLIENRFNMLEEVIHKESSDFVLSDDDISLLLLGKNQMDLIRDKTAEIVKDGQLKLRKRQDELWNETRISPITFLYTASFSLLVFVFSFFKICKDLRRLKLVNNQLLINKRLFEHSEKISNISNWCLNLESNSLTFSNNIYNLLSCTEEDFESSLKGYLKFVHPEDREMIIEKAKFKPSSLKMGTVYHRIIRKDKALRYFKSVSTLIKDNFDNNIVIGVVSDITEQHNDSRILEEKLFDLERTNKELTAFNHVASHDLQEPLRKIQTFISRIEEYEEESFSENVIKYFSRIKFAAKRMQKLIEDLLTFSRTNKAEKSFELTDLKIVIQNSVQDLMEQIDEKQATITISSMSMVYAIPFQLQQLFTNLIGNALKYSKKDVLPIIEISSEVICGKDLIKSSFLDENMLLKITISDNGIGFNQEYAEEIFTLFNRLHNKNEYSGNGIGLAICEKIAENHKGFIKAESVPGVGSVFTLFLPLGY